MNKKRISWKECLTFLSFEEAIQHRKTRTPFSLRLLTSYDQQYDVEGILISFNDLGNTLFYFTFVFDFDGQMFYIKIKQDVHDLENNYLMRLTYDEKKISQLKNLDTQSWQKEERTLVAV
jgi:hypothetical protein